MYYNNETIIYFNGEFVKATDAATDLYGQSLHYGYAVFEGIKSYATANGIKIFKAKEHFDRLRFSAETVHIPYRWTTTELVEVTHQLLKKNNLSNAYIRPLVFCPPNMGLSKGHDAQLVIMAWDWTNGYLGNKMLRLVTSSFRRPNPGAFKIEAKVTGHYVNSIMACQEAKDKGYDEAILLDNQGFIAEGPGANIFIEKNKVLYTPPKGNIMPGITRATVIEICKELNIEVEEKLFTAEEMQQADGAFYCGTAAEIVALESLDGHVFKKQWDETWGSIIQQAYQCKVLEKPFQLQETIA